MYFVSACMAATTCVPYSLFALKNLNSWWLCFFAQLSATEKDLQAIDELQHSSQPKKGGSLRDPKTREIILVNCGTLQHGEFKLVYLSTSVNGMRRIPVGILPIPNETTM